MLALIAAEERLVSAYQRGQQTMKTWHDDLKVGVPEIDGDHQHICDALDGLYELVISGASPMEILVHLQELADLLASHFSREEQMMHDIKYVGAEHYLKNHFEALRILSIIVFDCEKKNQHISDDTLMLIKVWTMEHIKNYDQPFADNYIAANINSIVGASSVRVKPAREYYA